MTTTIRTSTQGQRIIVSFLTDLLGTKENAPVYSIGFQRVLKLNKKQALSAFTALYLQGFKDIPSNNKELQNRLSAMSESEFEAFKKSI